MSMIKKFFERKKTDAKFKMAGSGKKLGDAQTAAAAAAQSRSAGPSGASRPSTSGGQKTLSNEQRQAAAAALERFSKSNVTTQEDFEKKRSRAAIRAQAMKELENEKAIEREATKLKDTSGHRDPIEVEGPRLLACAGVYFTCPMIGPDVLPKEEMRRKIREFLYEQVNEEQGLTAALMIHTLNKDHEKVKLCVSTLCKYLENIIQNPTEEKFQKIRKSNKAFQDRVSCMEGHDYFLEAAGFRSHVVEGEDFWVFQPERQSVDGLQGLCDALQSAEPIQATLDRGLRVLLPNQAKREVNLPPDFFSLTPDELKREQEARSAVVERESMLRTKAMREKEELRERRKYRFALIRIRFPDGLVLQGTFSVYEKFQDVLDFVMEHLCHQLPFVLYAPGSGSRLGEPEAETSLLDLALVPSTLLTFSWHPDMIDEIQHSLGSDVAFLNEETAALASPDYR